MLLLHFFVLTININKRLSGRNYLSKNITCSEGWRVLSYFAFQVALQTRENFYYSTEHHIFFISLLVNSTYFEIFSTSLSGMFLVRIAKFYVSYFMACIMVSCRRSSIFCLSSCQNLTEYSVCQVDLEHYSHT